MTFLVLKMFWRKNKVDFWDALLGMSESLPYFIERNWRQNLWGMRAKIPQRGKPVEILGIDCKKAVESI